MTNDKTLNLLGMARRANKTSLGHDACVTSIINGDAQVCLVSTDASQRLKDEMIHLCSQQKKQINVILTDYTMNELGICQGAKITAVLTVNEKGFANRINELTGRKSDI